MRLRGSVTVSGLLWMVVGVGWWGLWSPAKPTTRERLEQGLALRATRPAEALEHLQAVAESDDWPTLPRTARLQARFETLRCRVVLGDAGGLRSAFEALLVEFPDELGETEATRLALCLLEELPRAQGPDVWAFLEFAQRRFPELRDSVHRVCRYWFLLARNHDPCGSYLDPRPPGAVDRIAGFIRRHAPTWIAGDLATLLESL